MFVYLASALNEVHKQGMPHSDIYALHNMTTLFNNHTSKLSDNWRATATFVGMMVELIMWPYCGVHAYHCVAFLVCELVKKDY